MTLLNITISNHAATLATDSLMLGPDDRPVTTINKATPYPRLKIVMSGRGATAFVLAWAEMIPTLPARDIDELAGMATPKLRRLFRDCRCGESMVVHVGWSPQIAAPVGYVFHSGNHFRPQRLEPGSGSLIGPLPMTDAEDYPALMSMGGRALVEEDAAAFHIALAHHQLRADQMRHYGRPVGIGGPLHLYRVDQDGIKTTSLPLGEKETGAWEGGGYEGACGGKRDTPTFP